MAGMITTWPVVAETACLIVRCAQGIMRRKIARFTLIAEDV
jgi:hypothetical protein